MEDARSDSFEATRVESMLKEFLEAQRATAKEPTEEEKRARKRPVKGGSPGGLWQMPVGSSESLLHFRGR